MIFLLAGGDVTKVPFILEHVRLAEVEPYLQRQAEHREFERAVLGWCGVQLPWLRPTSTPATPVIPRDQTIGQACGQKLVSVCREFFGDQLPTACRTCPGPKVQPVEITRKKEK